MKDLESLKKELVEFTPQRFNDVYRSLIDVAQNTDREYEILDALSFIADCNLMLTQVNETLENLQDETQCQHCADKEKVIAFQDEQISLLKEAIETNKRVNDAQHKAIFGKENNLKVCEK